ncbi:GPO family capsid scaffolding protein [Aeromonas hydrophila]|uniref:GPO family capsid scaffolding protein n=1 Tax=Aeromonas hydrophila TaxID=644 RepID=UPI003D1C9B11
MASPNFSSLRTGWICVATEGVTVDKREITREWLLEMAEQYDPDLYTAVIWPEHDRGINFGTVRALKAEEEEGGKLKLFAILEPNRIFTAHNHDGQYQFCSIEPEGDFADTGKTYLLGIGVTDRPASIGTTRLQFNKSGRRRGASERLPLFQAAANTTEATTLLQRLGAFLAGHGNPAPHFDAQDPLPGSHTETNTMNEEQLAQILDALTALSEQQASLIERVATVEAAAIVSDTEETVEETAEDAATPTIEQQFKTLSDAMNAMGKKIDGVNSTINKFSAEKPGQRPSLLGGQSKRRVF